MGLSIPGLAEALAKLDTTSEQMQQMNDNLSRVVELLEEQNRILRRDAF
jgi:hypothetical protein